MKIEKVKHWTASPKNDVRVLGMPNVPKPLHSLAPRTVMGATKWNQMRKRCYERAGYKCEACGYQCEPGKAHAHELYDIDYEKGTSTFVRCVCLCIRCHLYVIHSGRALTMYKLGNFMYTKEKLLEGAEHGFKLISEYNRKHKDKIKVFSAMLDYLKQPELKDEMERLINHYHISFYSPISVRKGAAAWPDWKLVYDGREYPTPYADEQAWAKAMEKNNKRENRDKHLSAFSGKDFTKELKEEGWR